MAKIREIKNVCDGCKLEVSECYTCKDKLRNKIFCLDDIKNNEEINNKHFCDEACRGSFLVDTFKFPEKIICSEIKRIIAEKEEEVEI